MKLWQRVLWLAPGLWYVVDDDYGRLWSSTSWQCRWLKHVIIERRHMQITGKMTISREFIVSERYRHLNAPASRSMEASVTGGCSQASGVTIMAKQFRELSREAQSAIVDSMLGIDVPALSDSAREEIRDWADDDLIEVNDGLYAVKSDEGWYAHQENPAKSVGPLPTCDDALRAINQS